jgi:2-oxoacid:acceptor oxidoreductase delta subunit (pyruvate/2-ketoisovalerate family)
MLTAQGYFKEAWETILIENPLPGVCGRVCHHPCEQVCNRGEYDESVAIHTLERFLADTASRYELKSGLKKRPAKGQRIAIVGSGPSGLATAHFLALLGYHPDVFDAMPEPGGVLRWGIPLYRLPLVPLQEEIDRIQQLGVSIHCGKRITQRFLEEAHAHYDAVFLGCGHSGSLPLTIPGSEHEGVEDGLQFLARIRRGETPLLTGTVAVIGGGNTAIDVCRSAARLGAQPLLIYRRRRQDMPGFADEVEAALAEGVELWELHAPVNIEKSDGDFLLTLQRMQVVGEDPQGRARVTPDPGNHKDIRVQHIFTAIGATTSEHWYNPPQSGESVVHLSNCVIQPQPNGSVVAFGGDLVASFKSVVHSVASGKQAAMALDTFFQLGVDAIQSKLETCAVGPGPSLSMEIYLGGPRAERNHRLVAYQDLNTDYFQFAPRISQPQLLRDERLQSFAEIDLRIGATLAIREAERCFNCGLCNQCNNCLLFCPEIAVIRQSDDHGRSINYDYCKGCGLCVVECPRNAMRLEEESA